MGNKSERCEELLCACISYIDENIESYTEMLDTFRKLGFSEEELDYFEIRDYNLNELKNKKIEELSIREIGKYLIVAEELEWVDNYIGDDKVFYNYDKNLLEELSYKFEDSVFRLINEELLYDNNLHTYPDDLEDGVIV